MALAMQHYASGRTSEAEALWRQVLAADPQDAEVLHLLGVAADARGDAAGGAELIRQAIAIRDRPQFHCNLAMVLSHLDRHEEALESAGRALAGRAEYPQALNNLGVSLEALKRPAEAVEAYRRAVAASPDYAEAQQNLGNALRACGRMEEALVAFQHAVALHSARGPGTADGQAHLGHVLLQLNRFEEAVEACERGLALAPDHLSALVALGTALRGLNRLEASEGVLRRALAQRPAEAGGYRNLAITLAAQNRPLEALAVLDLGIAVDPADHETHLHRAMLLLRHGRWREGWEEYEWRLRGRQAADSYAQFVGQPVWRGEPLNGRTILLVPEQGFGDIIQFVRYIPLVARRGGRVLLGVSQPFLRLLADFPGIDALIGIGQRLPPYDVHCPLMSLPLAFGTTPETVPGATAYLKAPPEAASRWQTRLAQAGRLLRVGIVWAGNPGHVADYERSLPFALLAPLWRVPGIYWVSLQIGARAADLQSLPQSELPPGGLMDLSGELTDFAETAGVLAELDLVIAVDTSVAHLAGALGRPVWLLLPATPDWRWLRQGDTTAWYPTMRLFRQGADRTWAPVLARVAEALRHA